MEVDGEPECFDNFSFQHGVDGESIYEDAGPDVDPDVGVIGGESVLVIVGGEPVSNSGQSNSRKSVTDGVPSALRSPGRSVSMRSKNCSVKRTWRSGTLATLLAERLCGGEYL